MRRQSPLSLPALNTDRQQAGRRPLVLLPLLLLLPPPPASLHVVSFRPDTKWRRSGTYIQLKDRNNSSKVFSEALDSLTGWAFSSPVLLPVVRGQWFEVSVRFLWQFLGWAVGCCPAGAWFNFRPALAQLQDSVFCLNVFEPTARSRDGQFNGKFSSRVETREPSWMWLLR